MAIRKVYESLIRSQVAEQIRWNEGGNYVSEFQVQLRRSGEVMFVIPVRASGVGRFDQEAQRAIGATSPPARTPGQRSLCTHVRDHDRGAGAGKGRTRGTAGESPASEARAEEKAEKAVTNKKRAGCWVLGAE
jgi:hypothetical protein